MDSRALCLMLLLARLILYLSLCEAPSCPAITVDSRCQSFRCVCSLPCLLRPRRGCVWPVRSSRSLVLLLLACGDVHSNPGPGSTCEYPCLVCNRGVRDDQDGLYCEACFNWSHRVCVGMSESDYFHWASIDDGWVCPKCEREVFPFHNVSQISNCNSSSSQPPRNTTQSSHQSNSLRHLRILSLNARSLLPKIDELRGLCGSEKFDVICVSETWLSDAVEDHEVHIHGYNLLRKDRHRHGGGASSTLPCFQFSLQTCPVPPS